jgi:PAS domain S-box-containing protein
MPEISTPVVGLAQSILDTVRESLVVMDTELRVQSANRSFYQSFEVTPVDTEGRLIYKLGNGQWNIPRLRELLEHIIPQNSVFNDFQVEHCFPTIGCKTMLLNARKVRLEEGQKELILLAIEDITERRQAEEARREIETRYTSLVKNIKDHSIFMMDAKGNITSWNKEAERIIGYTEEDILGRHFSVIFSSEDGTAISLARRRVHFPAGTPACFGGQPLNRQRNTGALSLFPEPRL